MASLVVLLVGLYFIFKKFVDKNANTIFKCLSLVLAVVFFVRYFAVDGSLLDGVLNLTTNNPFLSPFLCFLVAISVWLEIASVVVLTLYSFFKFDILKNYAKTFCLFALILNIALLPQVVYSYTGSYNWSLCGIFMEIEIAISLAMSVYLFCKNGFFKIPKKQLMEMLIALPIVLLATMPPFILGDFFGIVGAYNVKSFHMYHRFYLYFAFIVLFALYLLLKRKDKEYCRMALLFISLGTLISYCFHYDFSLFVTPWDWPLHLCNTAMFIVPLCLIFRMKRLFYFSLFINVLGAFLAMLIPNFNDINGAFSTIVVKFWINHIVAFVMPLLIVLLRVYERPKLKQFYYSIMGFGGYFLFVMIVNAWFSNYLVTVDYFFINSDFVASKLGYWAESLRNIIWGIQVGNVTLIIYPLYQFLYFLVYILMGLGCWFIFAWMFQIQDFYLAVSEKNQKIKLDANALCVKYGKKDVYQCMNSESVNKLVVKNVYKRYGTNKYYSVQNANIEVQAGEIFGFLGPNGAGKSTIIKCIVGIQTVTKGSIEINGYDIEKQPVKAKEQFGFVPDHYALYEKLTGREYINYIADLYGVSQKDRDERLNKYVTMLAMENSFDNQIRTYSHGMKQKIAIMSALVHNPKLWILDEPLTGLDPTSIYQVKECMKEHAKSGNIVFFSSHIIDIVEKLCDRIMIIKKGQIRTSVTLDELKEKNISLEKFYLDIIEGEEEDNREIVEENPEFHDNMPDTKFFKKKPTLVEKWRAKRNAKKQKQAILEQNCAQNGENTNTENQESLIAENTIQQENAKVEDSQAIKGNTQDKIVAKKSTIKNTSTTKPQLSRVTAKCSPKTNQTKK